MEIQIADQRPPLSVAIGLAKKQGDQRLPVWEAEMIQMVVEVTRKFHGSITSENVTRGLETSIGILGLGLMSASQGVPDAAVWVQQLQLHGIKKLSALAVGLVKQIVDLPATDYLNPSTEFTPTPREQLLYFAKEGYSQLKADEAKRHRNRQQVELARWLLANTSVGPSARRYLADVLKDIATVDDAFFYVLPRMAQIPLKYLPGQMEDEESFGDDFDDSFDEYGGDLIKLPPGLWKDAKKRYTEFCETLPETLKPALVHDGHDWFDAHVQRSLVEKPERTREEPRVGRVDEASAMKELLRAIMAIDSTEPGAPARVKKPTASAKAKKTTAPAKAKKAAAPAKAKKPATSATATAKATKKA